MSVLAPRLNGEIVRPSAEALAVIVLALLLLSPAIWNGFPIIYYDTGAYLFEGLTGHFIPERAAVYSLFLRYAGAGTSLWIIAIVQAVMSAFVIAQCARTAAPRMRWLTLVLVGAGLVIATSLPWYSGEIEPDCFTALLVLSLYLLAFAASALGWLRGIVVGLIGALSIAVHPSHFVLAGFLFVVLVALRFLWPRPRLIAPALVCTMGLFMVLAGNFYFTRQVFISRAGAPFVFARMLQDGIIMRLLDDTCPQSGYQLCAYKNELPPTADGYLWTPRSPFFALGHFRGTAAESARMVLDAVERYPLLQLRAALADAIVQFGRFGTGEGMESQQWVLGPVFAHLIPKQMPAYLSARQQQGGFDFRIIRKTQTAIGFISLAAMITILLWAIRARRPGEAGLALFVLAALVGNAIICGVISGPHDRYQSRLIWLTLFVVALGYAPKLGSHKSEKAYEAKE